MQEPEEDQSGLVRYLRNVGPSVLVAAAVAATSVYFGMKWEIERQNIRLQDLERTDASFRDQLKEIVQKLGTSDVKNSQQERIERDLESLTQTVGEISSDKTIREEKRAANFATIESRLQALEASLNKPPGTVIQMAGAQNGQ